MAVNKVCVPEIQFFGSKMVQNGSEQSLFT